jgi:DNA-binding MarR family transcriptional regulator
MDATRPSGPPRPEPTAPDGAPAYPAYPEGWTSSPLSEVFYAVLNAMPALRSAFARRMRLNLSEVDAMEHLMGEAMGPVELSRRLHMTSASASVLVDRLEEAGHVVREPDPTDGRRRVVRPTEQGAAGVFGQVAPLVSDLVALEDDMTAKERDAVMRYLSRVLDVIEAHAEIDATEGQPPTAAPSRHAHPLDSSAQ